MRKRMSRLSGRALMAGALLGMVVGCASVQTTNTGAVGVNRTQYVSSLVSPAQVEQAAAEAYAQALQEASSQRALNRDPAEVQRVQNIASRLIAQVPAFRPDAAAWNWQVNVIESDDINAWCMPGGRIAVYTGLIDKLNASDAELAAVIGHEIAHALREHTREKMSQQQLSGMGLAVVGMVTGRKEVVDLTGSLTQVMFTLPYSREFETEADAIGVELAARAGYDPRAAVTLWQKMAAQGGSGPEILSTHPSSTTRIQNLQRLAQQVMPLYEQSRGAGR